jgi:hypothetical protein
MRSTSIRVAWFKRARAERPDTESRRLVHPGTLQDLPTEGLLIGDTSADTAVNACARLAIPGYCTLAARVANVLILSINITSPAVSPGEHEQDTAISTDSRQW